MSTGHDRFLFPLVTRGSVRGTLAGNAQSPAGMSLPLPVPRNRSFSFKTGQHAGLIADKRSFRVNGIANPGDYSHWYRARAPLLHGVRVHRHCHKKSQTADTVQDSGGGTGGGSDGRIPQAPATTRRITISRSTARANGSHPPIPCGRITTGRLP